MKFTLFSCFSSIIHKINIYAEINWFNFLTLYLRRKIATYRELVPLKLYPPNKFSKKLIVESTCNKHPYSALKDYILNCKALLR